MREQNAEQTLERPDSADAAAGSQEEDHGATDLPIELDAVAQNHQVRVQEEVKEDN